MIIGFNPRARAGRDLNGFVPGEKTLVSIHAPARGATVAPFEVAMMDMRFNPRARAGRD